MEGSHRLNIFKPGAIKLAGVGQRVRQGAETIVAFGQLNPRRTGRVDAGEGVELSTAQRVYRVRYSPRLERIAAGWTLRAAAAVFEVVYVDPVREPQARWLDLYVKTIKAAG